MDPKKYYEKEYGDDSGRGLKTPFLFRNLRRFELNRYDLAYQLAPGGNRALDIGCGDGELLFKLRGKYKEVWGIDIAEPRISRLEKKVGNDTGVHARVEDANGRLGFEDGYFDTVTAVATLEHIFDPFHVIRECNRLLCREGTLIVEVPNIAWLQYRLRSLMGKVPESSHCRDAEWDYAHLHSFTRASLKRLFEGEGFEVARITCGGIFAGIRRMWGSLLGPDVCMVGTKKA